MNKQCLRKIFESYYESIHMLSTEEAEGFSNDVVIVDRLTFMSSVFIKYKPHQGCFFFFPSDSPKHICSIYEQYGNIPYFAAKIKLSYDVVEILRKVCLSYSKKLNSR